MPFPMVLVLLLGDPRHHGNVEMCEISELTDAVSGAGLTSGSLGPVASG